MSSGSRLGPVLLTVLLDLVGFGLVIPLLSFYAETTGATPLQVTLLMASYSVAQFIGAPLWGALSDRVGRRPVMLASIFGTAAMLAGFAAADTLATMFLFRTLHGLCAANISTAQAYVADITTPENRAKGMGLIGAAFGLGFSIGPWMGGELSQFGLSVPIWVAAGLSALNFVWALFGLPESSPVAERAKTQRSLSPLAMLDGLRHPVVGMAVGLTFVATFAFSMMESTFALVGEHSWGMQAHEIGRLFGLIGLIGIVIQGGLIGRMVKVFGETKLVMAGYAFNAAGLAVLAVAGPGWMVPAGCVCLALGSSMANPSLSSLISRGSAGSEQGRILGINQSFSALARAAAPSIGGLIYTHWYPGGAFAASALITLVAVVLALPAASRAAAALATTADQE